MGGGVVNENYRHFKLTFNLLETKLQNVKEYKAKIIAKKLMHLHNDGKLIKLISFYFNLIIVPSTKCTKFSFRGLK